MPSSRSVQEVAECILHRFLSCTEKCVARVVLGIPDFEKAKFVSRFRAVKSAASRRVDPRSLLPALKPSLDSNVIIVALRT